MIAEIVATGTEIILGEIADTNSQKLGKLFAKYGIEHHRRTTIDDDLDAIVEAIRSALDRADLVVTIGGLGPTYDDLTIDAVSKVLGEVPIVDPVLMRRLHIRMARMKRSWNPLLERMARRPASSSPIANPEGSAVGLITEFNGKTIVNLPGPKNEFAAVLLNFEKRWLSKHSNGVIATKTMRIVGIPESVVELKVKDLLDSKNPTIAPYVKLMEVHLRIAARAKSEVEAMHLIEPMAEAIRERFGKNLFSESDEDLAEVVVKLLIAKNKTLATAESCTGGMLGQRITSVPGSSEAYIGGFITYTNELKAREVSVARYDLAKYGAVSEPVARQMAEGAARVAQADFGIGITGIAGPGGATKDKPVGRVYIAVAGPRGTEVREQTFSGDRETVRFRSTQVALQMLREELLAID